MWNEPNFAIENRKTESGEELVRPIAFGNFLIAAANAIHAAQAEQSPGAKAQVLMGGLYLGPIKQLPNWNYESFIEAVYQTPGLATAYDGVAIHPYAFDPTHPTGKTIAEFKEEVNGARAALNKQSGGSGLPLWITEMGWPVEGTGAPTVTLAEQKRLLAESFDWVKEEAAAKNIQSLIWFTQSDTPLATWDHHVGLITQYTGAHSDYKPAWFAFQAETGAPAWPTVETPTAMALEANGVWAANSLQGIGIQEWPFVANAVDAGSGGLQMKLDTNGAVWGRGSVGPFGGWVQESPPGETAISAGGKGLQMLLDGPGAVWAKSSVMNGGWIQETPAGEAAISAGGNGFQMVLEPSGQVAAKFGIFNGGWSAEGLPSMRATAISAGL